MSPSSSAEAAPPAPRPAGPPRPAGSPGPAVPAGPSRPAVPAGGPRLLRAVPGASASPAVYTDRLHKRFGKTVAVQSMSLTVERGEVFGFLGPNGAGKTTVVKLLLGLVRPTGGEAMVLGATVGDRATRRQIGYLPELFRFQGWLTAREVLRLHCRLLDLPKAGWPPAIDGALRTVGLAERGGDKVAGFSKGMQQRLGLGVALLGDPALVVLDEPTSALDPVGRHDVRQIIQGLRDQGTTVFLNTHLLGEAELVCDRVAVVDRGTTVAVGTLAEIVGRQNRVRLKVAGLAPGWWHPLANFGTWRPDGDWLVVEGADRVPALVNRIVSLGGQVEAVIPEQESLEQRFLDLLGEEQ